MSKSIKLKNNTYLDSSSIVHNKKNLKELLDDGIVYSTKEQVIGTWIDGRPIYMKVLDVGSYTWTATTNKFAHKIDNIDIMLDIDYTMFYDITGRWYLNWDALDTENWTSDGTYIYIVSTASATVFSQLYFILIYVKKTTY